MGIIYKVTNIKTGKSYIGKTIYTIEDRMISHYNNLKYLKTYFSSAIKKYGKDSFSWEVIEECDNEKLNEKEMYYIKTLNTKVPNGYNLTNGGDGASIGELNVSKRKDVRLKLKEKSSNFKHSIKTKKLLSKIAKKQFKNGMPIETRQKISKTLRESKNRKIYYFISPENKIIKITNLTDFCLKNNLDCSSMVKVSKYKERSHKGYRGI